MSTTPIGRVTLNPRRIVLSHTFHPDRAPKPWQVWMHSDGRAPVSLGWFRTPGDATLTTVPSPVVVTEVIALRGRMR